MSHPALEVVVTVLRRQVDDLVALGAAVREDRPDAVHDMRTVVRRLRTTLAAARPVLDRRVTDPLRERLGGLGIALEPARDAEVRAELAQELATIGGTDPAIPARLVAAARTEYDRDRLAVVAMLDAPPYAELIRELSELTRRPPVGADAYRGQRPVLRRVLLRQATRARRRLGALDETDLDSLHEARKAVRRVRYLAEAIAQYAPGGADAGVAGLGSAARELQDVLGDHRDAVLHARWIAGEAEAAERAGENPEAYRRLERIERDRADELAARRGGVIDAFEAARGGL